MTGPGSPAPPGAVFFLSDYGLVDEFVGVVHAVLHRLAPGVPVVDLTHQVPPYDVRAGAATLARALPHLGPGVVLAVVDPGVGGPRRAVALELAGTGHPDPGHPDPGRPASGLAVPGRPASGLAVPGHPISGHGRPGQAAPGHPVPGHTAPGHTAPGPRWLVGPDNGLLLPAAAQSGGICQAVALDRAAVNRAAVDRAVTAGSRVTGGLGTGETAAGSAATGQIAAGSAAATFDGRDLFGPAAALLWAGVDGGVLGDPVPADELVWVPDPVVERGTLDDGRRLLRAEVVWVDRFGNAQLGADGDAVPPSVPSVAVSVAVPTASAATVIATASAGTTATAATASAATTATAVTASAGTAAIGPDTVAVSRVRTFSDLGTGQPGLLSDGNGRLALVVREGSAAARFGIAPGDLVELVW
ncbi:MAG TPA: SAM-dependent chlorinase/fluorinase [Acidimicrobiales bacterium]|nr:SAM-dependent chlorinase/fluorinase [Acidimicrobiales bacterium]